MKKKFWFLTKTSLLKKIKNKTFVIVNILMAIVLICLTNIDKIVTFFGGDFSKNNNIMVVDNTNESYEIFKKTIDNTDSLIDTNLNYTVKKVNTEEELKKKIKKEKDIGIVLNKSDENILEAKLITYGYINSNMYQLLQSSINSSKQVLAIKKLDISEEDLNKISSNVNIDREFIEDDKNQDEETINMIMSILTPIIIMPFFLLIMLVIQMIGAEINEEKATKSMEIIISNVSAKVHFFSKIASANIFVLLQIIILFIDGLIGILFRGGKSISKVGNLGDINEYISSAQSLGITNKLSSYIPIIIILMIITLLAYSILAGILASMTTNMEDFQQLQTPIIVISMIGFYLAIMNTIFDGALFIRILSYIPFISAILSPSLLLTGVIGVKDMILSILLMVIVVYLLLKYGLKIYKEGILNYSSSKLWKKMFKALKN
jgi:ABC-2 type transport system permease protein